MNQLKSHRNHMILLGAAHLFAAVLAFLDGAVLAAGTELSIAAIYLHAGLRGHSAPRPHGD